LLLEIKAKLW